MHTSNTNRGGRATTTSRNDDEDDNGPLSNEGALSAKIIGALPLEKVETKRSLENKTVKELTAEVKENQTKKCPRSKTKFEGPYPLEKAELVDFVLHLRGEPVCVRCASTSSRKANTYECCRARTGTTSNASIDG